MSRVSSEGVGQWWPAAGLGGTDCNSTCLGSFEGGQNFHYLHHSLAQVNREGTQLHPSTENWIKDLLTRASPNRIRSSFPLSQSIPSGSFHKPLILLYQRANRLKTKITERITSKIFLNKSINLIKSSKKCHEVK